MYCSHCSNRRQHRHIGDDYRSKFCLGCRKAGHDSVRYCKFCGGSVEENNDACAHHIQASVISNSSESDDNDDDVSFNATDSSDGVSGDEDHESDDAGSDEEDIDSRSPSISPRPLSRNSSRASIQLQRVKCNVCNLWFDDEADLRLHDDTNSASCREHGMCFPQVDLYDHARDYTHQRCFVRGCNSNYAKYDHSDVEEVEDHIYDIHADRS